MKTRWLSTLLSFGALVGVAACSAASSGEATEQTNQKLCNGDTCWECSEVPAPGGTKTHCETECSEPDGTTYECGADDTSTKCPPPGADKAKGKDKTKEPKAKDGGASGERGGGPFKCKVERGKRACQSEPSCPAGTHPAPCGACVPDTCDSCDCNGGGSDTPKGGGNGGGRDGGAGTDGSCTLTQGFWKNHPSAWPVDTLTLGNASYGKTELLALFGTPPKGDASIVLAHQLVASLLNTGSGASTAQVGGAIDAAQAWLTANADADGRLPFGVSSSGAAGSDATRLAGELDAYNNGNLGTPHCE